MFQRTSVKSLGNPYEPPKGEIYRDYADNPQ